MSKIKFNENLIKIFREALLHRDYNELAVFLDNYLKKNYSCLEDVLVLYTD